MKEYLDAYDGVRSKILCTTIFDENSYLGATNLGKVNMSRSHKIKEVERFLISEQSYTIGKIGKVLDAFGHQGE